MGTWVTSFKNIFIKKQKAERQNRLRYALQKHDFRSIQKLNCFQDRIQPGSRAMIHKKSKAGNFGIVVTFLSKYTVNHFVNPIFFTYHICHRSWHGGCQHLPHNGGECFNITHHNQVYLSQISPLLNFLKNINWFLWKLHCWLFIKISIKAIVFNIG